MDPALSPAIGCLAGLLFVCPAIQEPAPSAAPASPDVPVDLQAPDPLVRAEYFVLRDPDRTPEADPAALISWKRSSGQGGELLEREVLFGEGELRVLHTENMGLASPRLVWRELGAHGRTWLAEWLPGPGLLRSLEFGSADRIHDQAQVGAVCFPLALVEELRAGLLRTEELQLVSPTRAGVEPVRLVRRAELPADLPGWALDSQARAAGTCVELRTQSGDLLVCYIFEGAELRAFQWASGGGWALRVEEAEWVSRVQRWRADQARRESPVPSEPAQPLDT